MPTITAQTNPEVYDPACGDGKVILTPPAPPAPRINGKTVYGVRPGSPVLYRIPATGERPMQFSVDGLPAGLTLDEQAGIIRGTIISRSERDYPMTFYAENCFGDASREFTIRVGDALCLTPPMGWNSWNCWGPNVSQKHVLDSARSMVSKGLTNYGWNYINIDDGWQGERGGAHNAIQPNPATFPDIGNLCDELHAMGLKIGIYSTPWVATYAGYIGGSSDSPDGAWSAETMGGQTHKRKSWYCGRYFFGENDTAQWAEWGIDYLKYDWNPNDPESTLRMAEALRECGRDIVYSLSNSAPLEHAELYAREVHCWRTTGDLKDRWNQDGTNLNMMDVWSGHRSWMEEGVCSGPGHFPDADMLVVGDVVEKNRLEKPRPSRLTSDEQYAHISLWTLWSSPMLIGCLVETMDKFTLGLLTNAEVIDIHQDSAAISGRTVFLIDGIEIIVKELADGSRAIGLFNVNDEPRTVTFNWEQTGLFGEQMLRDVWRNQNIGVFEKSFSANVRSHGVVLLRTKPVG